MIKLPLYAMRSFYEITKEGDFDIVSTYRSKYVLDCKSLGGTFATRRLKMLGMKLPYRVYPINIRIETFSQLVSCGRKKFIDVDGTVHTWKPSKFFPVVCYPISFRWVTAKGKTIIIPKELNTKFILSRDLGYTHVQVIKVGRLNLLYDVGFEHVRTTRKKI